MEIQKEQRKVLRMIKRMKKLPYSKKEKNLGTFKFVEKKVEWDILEVYKITILMDKKNMKLFFTVIHNAVTVDTY